MAFSPAMTAALTCPHCADQPLELVANSLLCRRCGKRYPFVGTIPCLVPDPPLWRSLWLTRLAEFVADTAATLAGWRAEAEAAPLPRTRARVERVIAACQEQRAFVQALFEDLEDGEPRLLPTRPEAGDNPVLEFSENLFRDWVWGEKELEQTLALVTNLMTEPPGRLAVYGAGAGRLAVDVHRALRPSQTWALDLNPLPLLAAERLLRGETLTVPEFPVAPHSEDDVAITRRLQLPHAVPEGFSFLFADALQPPFAPGSLDTVLTVWFVDATGIDFRQTAAAVNRVLRPGGLWVNLGPLRFKQSLAGSYTIEELWELLPVSGFELGQRGRSEVPYFDSPVSGSRRIETVFWFAARKAREAEAFTSEDRTPPWIADTSLPIPLTPSLIALRQKSVFAGSVLSLIDGARSLSDVADEMGRLWGFDAARIQDQLRAFFATLPSTQDGA